MTARDATIAEFSAWRAEREHRERQVLKAGLAAAVDALFEFVPDQDVRMVLVAMYGDPHAAAEDRPEDGRSVPVEAQFISLDRARPLTDAQRRYLALETMRAASDALYREMKLGLELADLIEDLGKAVEAGDQQAKAQLELIIASLNRSGALPGVGVVASPAAINPATYETDCCREPTSAARVSPSIRRSEPHADEQASQGRPSRDPPSASGAG